MALTLASAGGSFLSPREPGLTCTCAPCRTTERTRDACTRLWMACVHGRAAGGVSRQLRPARRHDRAAAALPEVHATSAPRCATSPASTSAAAPSTSTWRCAGPELEKLAEYGEPPQARRPASSAAIVDVDTTLQLDKPELRVVDRPPAGGRPARGHPADRHRAAPHGGRRRPGLALPRPDRQRRLRRADPPDARSYRGEPQHDLAAVRLARLRPRRNAATGAPAQVGLAPGGGLVRLDNVVKHRADADRLAHRPHRPRSARRAIRARHRAGLRPGRPHRGC